MALATSRHAVAHGEPHNHAIGNERGPGMDAAIKYTTSILSSRHAHRVASPPSGQLASPSYCRKPRSAPHTIWRWRMPMTSTPGPTCGRSAAIQASTLRQPAKRSPIRDSVSLRVLAIELAKAALLAFRPPARGA